MLGAVTWTCTRPIEIVIRPKFLFDFRVSDAYVSAQLFDGCLYYFFMLVVVVRYETAATARRALLFIVRAFFNDTIAVAVWTGFHMRLMAMLPQSHDYIRWCFADPAIAARPHDVRFTPKSGHSSAWCEPGHAGLICRGLEFWWWRAVSCSSGPNSITTAKSSAVLQRSSRSPPWRRLFWRQLQLTFCADRLEPSAMILMPALPPKARFD